MARVVLAPALARWLPGSDGEAVLDVPGANVGEVLDGVFARHPTLRHYGVDAAFVSMIILSLAGCASHPVSQQARVSCSAGPLAADFGGQPWFAFACDDGRSVALFSASGNAAAPFSFVLRPSDHGVRVQGDGAGDRAATAAAFAELMALDDAALRVLFERAMLAPAPDGS